jgi:hypothetical protein
LAALLLLTMSLLAGAAEPSSTPAGLDADTLAMVKTFLRTPTDQLPVEFIPRFLAVDPAALSVGLRQGFMAKRVELYTLKQISEGKKKGTVRMPAEDCSIPKGAKGPTVGILKMAGYVEITEDEERWLMDKTHCTERDLMCEFTLQVIAAKAAKRNQAQRFLLINSHDPIFAMIAQYRGQGHYRQTAFFGVGTPTCASHQ